MPEPSEHDVAALLDAVVAGDTAAAERLFPLIYGELHRIATACMQRERGDHTLQPTALVHEAYIRLLGSTAARRPFQNQRHFIATAAVAMRRILINHARSRDTQKRGGDWSVVSLDDVADAFQQRSIDLVALDDALEELAGIDAGQARLVELRFFGGMTMEQCAEHLSISTRQAHYEWTHARAWLRGRLEGG